MMHVNDDEEDAMDTVSHVSLALSLTYHIRFPYCNAQELPSYFFTYTHTLTHKEEWEKSFRSTGARERDLLFKLQEDNERVRMRLDKVYVESKSVSEWV